MQAIILAAGMGRRLRELTKDIPKCMIKVNEVTLIERMLVILDKHRLNRIIIVIGHKSEVLIKFVNSLSLTTPIYFIYNNDYKKTNNIYSLFLARQELKEDDTLLFESDLVFDEAAVKRLLSEPYPNLVLVDKYESWMDGAVTQLDEHNNIKNFISRSEFDFKDVSSYYKTVNIYKFSRPFSNTHYVPFLEAYSSALGNNSYYEQVLKVIALLEKPDIKAVKLKGERWYEIDNAQDLDIAQSIFAKPAEQYKKFQLRHGGYWRYADVLDFHYLVNPFFPPQRLMDEIKTNFETLLCQYPSGLNVNNIIMAECFGLCSKNVVAGNGAAELIKSVVGFTNGIMGIIRPTFDEYPNRKSPDELLVFTPPLPDFKYCAHDVIHFFDDKPIQSLVLVNPDIPTGNFIPKQDLLKIAEWATTKNIRLIVDESFVDFTASTENQSLMNMHTLNQYKNMVVIKSISKSYGVPGLRLGLLASGDQKFVSTVKRDISIWNINSYAEFFLQIIGKYKDDYRDAMRKFKVVRTNYIAELKELPFLRVIDSQANFVMCEVLPPFNSLELSEKLLSEHRILIRSLSGKAGFDGRSYCRIAIRTESENSRLFAALREILR
ncbi:MAG: aminotransferase class I/II-fold pyridoxal phosphate-dependent enzyme [Oscillospiraceae bacterium]|nr:aminotransferase class I/II-fold pyridoxal phosphate-dependent enzyme [Oscillospiraceae bacterium]